MNNLQSEGVDRLRAVDFDHNYPVAHPPVDAPLCSNCQHLNLEFFDPSCPGCREILNNPNTTVAELFACMRQWVPQTQRNIEGLVEQVLKRGANVNDRDGLTDMTLLHFACKAGASGVGDAIAATRTVKFLLLQGADVNVRCKWTQMTALHYAAYFDAAPIVQLLLETAPDIDINSTCEEYNKGTALHIAAANLCYETAQILLQRGARLSIRDALGRVPKDCVPDADEFIPLPHVQDTVQRIKQLLSFDEYKKSLRHIIKSAAVMEPVSGRALLKSMDLTYGSRVLIAGVKSGTLRFCGTTEFAVGLWIGVELDTPEGKNDGTINGIEYFKCSKPNHGIFVPINKITKIGSPKLARKPSVRLSNCTPIKHSKIDLSRVTSKIETGLMLSKSMTKMRDINGMQRFQIGERVMVSGKCHGTIRFHGETQFSSGLWYGIELDDAKGKNDGSVREIRYFHCAPNHGIFSSSTSSRIKKILTLSDDCLFELDSSADGSNGTRTPGGVRTPGGLRAFNESQDRLSPNFKSAGSFKRSTFHASFRIKTPNRSPRMLSTKLDTISASPEAPQSKPQKNGCWLNEGVNVLVNNELGIVRYIGPVEFADGIWIGVELRQAHGKNNGTVNGKSYFSCKPGHGLLVRPHKVSVHGIKGSKLLEENGYSSTF